MNEQLEYKWNLYVHYSCGSNEYNTSYEHIGTLDTIGKWQQYFCHMIGADILVSTNKHIYHKNNRVVSYSMFRDGILPSWEDKVNKYGKEWGCRQFLEPDDAKKIWLNLCADCVLGNIDAVGIRVLNKSNTTRNVSKIEVWMEEKNDELNTFQQICDSLKDMEMPSFTLLEHTQKQNDAELYFVKCMRKRRR
jgi:hypothetical protein